MSSHKYRDSKFNIFLSVYPDAWTMSLNVHFWKKEKQLEIHVRAWQMHRQIMVLSEGSHQEGALTDLQ